MNVRIIHPAFGQASQEWNQNNAAEIEMFEIDHQLLF
jgi:hypothetical protein